MKFDSGLKKLVWWKFNYNAIESKNYIHWTLTLFWLADWSLRWIFKISACDVITADYMITMSRTLKATGNRVVSPQSMISEGNHVNFARFMLLAVSEEEEIWPPSFCIQWMINLKQLLNTVFVISRIIKVLLRFISVSLRLQLKTPYSTLIFLDITKTISNIG